MASKVALLKFGLLAIVVLISSKGEARLLTDTTKTKSVDSRCLGNSDCFSIPGLPSFGGLPGFGGIPGFGGTPLLPGGPKANVVIEKNDMGKIKDSKKVDVAGRCAEGTDCFNIPGLPSFGGLPGFGGIPGFGGTPLLPGGPRANVMIEKNDVGKIKDSKKLDVAGKCAENTDCFSIPGLPSFGGIPGFGGLIPGFGGVPVIGTPLLPVESNKH